MHSEWFNETISVIFTGLDKGLLLDNAERSLKQILWRCEECNGQESMDEKRVQTTIRKSKTKCALNIFITNI